MIIPGDIDTMGVLRAEIADGARRNTASTVQAIIDEAKRWKPASYDATAQRRRDHYEGKGSKWVKAALMSLFPSTGDGIPPIAYNWAKLHADISAAVYDREPDRDLFTVDGDEIDSEDPRSIDWADVLRKSGIRTQMPECERRASWAGDCVVSVRPRSSLDHVTGKITTVAKVEVHWPSDVWAIPHPSAPTDDALAIAWVFRVASRSGVNDPDGTFEIWTRDSVDDEENGAPLSFGPWRVSISTADGKGTRVGQEYEYKGTITPFAIYHYGIPAGCPWVDRGPDDVALVESLNVDVSDESYITHLQSHTDKVYQGTRAEAAKLIGGPDKIHKIDPGETLTSLDMNPKIIEMGVGNQRRLKLWAMSKRHSQDAYSVDAQSPTSGVARQIANEPQDKARREAEAYAKEFEETRLLPILRDVVDTFTETTIGPVQHRFSTRAVSQYEDPEAKQRRVLEQRDARLISDARAAVELGIYDSIDDATAAMLSDVIGSAVALPPVAPQTGGLPDQTGGLDDG